MKNLFQVLTPVTDSISCSDNRYAKRAYFGIKAA